MSAVAGLERLWRLTTGDRRVGVAVIDGAVDDGHAALAGAGIMRARGDWPAEDLTGVKAAHGTAVASVLFGRHDGPVPGVAPGCRAVSVPAFCDQRRTSQLDLARAIETAADTGVHVINISGGQLAAAEEAEALLTRAVRQCTEQGVLVVAAAGNDGCRCDHVPAALPGVLAVGACDDAGRPLPISNFGPGNSRRGLLAPGHDVLVAVPGGGTTRMSGTSLATPIVSGVAALLLSLQLSREGRCDPIAVGDLLLKTADPCDLGQAGACARYLAGTLNITKAVNAMTSTPPATSDPTPGRETIAVSGTEQAPPYTGEPVLSGCDCTPTSAPAPAPAAQATPPYETAGPQTATPSAPAHTAAGPQMADLPAPAAPLVAPAAPLVAPAAAGVLPSGEDAGTQVRRLVYALGGLGYDFGTEARRDTFKQLMPPVDVDGVPLPANPYDPRQMVDYLTANPSEARPLIWTLNLDLTPIYAIEPVSGYAPGVYERLVEFLARQLLADDSTDFVDRVSVPGRLPGRTVKLFSGQVVPVVEIDLNRGLYGWSVASLAHAVADCGVPEHNQRVHPRDDGDLQDAVADFLTRIYYDLRNFGATSRDRALNFAATNAVQARETLAQALGRGMALQDIDVEKSPYARPDSDCWDVKLRFFDPDNSRRAKRVYRFTIDVKDVLPVTIGEVRSWPEA
ncbi:PatA/PatG family cyanobactin maturation protease [Actinoallomurus purpureus]|uniref:PatA/PatG family cyanobactin maturation protease n=1 Tax=Actinoallomurus purpureus TaxID=478114 RepID=UPI002093BC97|nr:PatA/PatG family cyanobactin maturation protease [Actinoallomurus purpureus]MCO6008514.1 PatA/PatG family cyanobactin maturation protease [Actinoallomurus purpureus]